MGKHGRCMANRLLKLLIRLLDPEVSQFWPPTPNQDQSLTTRKDLENAHIDCIVSECTRTQCWTCTPSKTLSEELRGRGRARATENVEFQDDKSQLP
jgi:hypothetical protein